MFFCVLHDGIDSVQAAGHIDPAYRVALRDAMAAGVEVMVYKAALSEEAITLSHRLPFSLDP